MHSVLQVNGPKKNIFVIYFVQITHMLCFLLKSGKKKIIKSDLPTLIFWGDLTGNTLFFGLIDVLLSLSKPQEKLCMCEL